MNFCLIWKKEKEIVITGFAWILQKENQSHLKLRNTSQRVVLSRYVSNYSQNSCLYSIPHSGCFGIFNVLLIGVDEKGHKLLGWNWFFVCLLCYSFSWCHWSHLIFSMLKICFESFPLFSPWIYPWTEAIYVHLLLTFPWDFFSFMFSSMLTTPFLRC